uniref:Peptidylglycine alpha-hydroxylating monooxygenase n=1 Tax=Magallana gigas TaxID=29159 RepID=K1QA02_MAGGI
MHAAALGVSSALLLKCKQAWPRALSVRPTFTSRQDCDKMERMATRAMIKLTLCVGIILTVRGAPQRRDTAKIPLKMPQVSPKVKDTYLCHAIETTGFEPDANKDIAHHILIYGCTTPGSRDSVW